MAKIVRRKQPDQPVEISDIKGRSTRLPVPQFDLEVIRSLIQGRRSVFPVDYEAGAVIPREQIAFLLECAHWAPNHGKTEPWFFKVFSGPALARLGKAHADLYKRHTPPDEFKPAKHAKLEKRPTQCSHMIAICMRRGDNPKIPELEEIEAVACAVQNLWLAASSQGLAGYWSSGGMTYHDEMRDWLGLGPEDRCLGFFHLGLPKNGWPQGTRKKSWQQKVEWVEE